MLNGDVDNHPVDSSHHGVIGWPDGHEPRRASLEVGRAPDGLCDVLGWLTDAVEQPGGDVSGREASGVQAGGELASASTVASNVQDAKHGGDLSNRGTRRNGGATATELARAHWDTAEHKEHWNRRLPPAAARCSERARRGGCVHALGRLQRSRVALTAQPLRIPLVLLRGCLLPFWNRYRAIGGPAPAPGYRFEGRVRSGPRPSPAQRSPRPRRGRRE